MQVNRLVSLSSVGLLFISSMTTLVTFIDLYLIMSIIGRTDAEAETPILWPPDARADSLEKTLMLGRIEGGRRRE